MSNLTPNKYVGGLPFTSKVAGLNPECVGSLMSNLTHAHEPGRE